MRPRERETGLGPATTYLEANFGLSAVPHV